MARRKKRKGRIVSNGVKSITQFLKGRAIVFTVEHKFPDCKSIRPLPFDFAIFKDSRIVGLIEFQGVQHYIPCRKFGGKKALSKQQKHDSIKIEWCKNNNVPLLLVSYLDQEKIEELCLEFLGIIGLNS